jgi:hypothetical protein
MFYAEASPWSDDLRHGFIAFVFAFLASQFLFASKLNLVGCIIPHWLLLNYLAFHVQLPRPYTIALRVGVILGIMAIWGSVLYLLLKR